MTPNDRAIVGFSMIGHSMFHLYELAIPLFIVYWLVAFDVSAAVIGLLVGGGLAMIGLGAIGSGVLADEYGSKRLMTASILGMGGSFLLIGLAPRIEVLALALIVWGIASSLYHPAALSLLTRGPTERGTALAYHGAAGNVGTALGPFAAAVLLTVAPWKWVAIAFAAPAVLAAAIAFRFEFDERAGSDGVNGDGPDVDEETGTDVDEETGTDVDEETGTDVDERTTRGGITDLRGFLAQSKHLFTGGFLVAFAIMMVHGVYSRGILSFLPEILADLPLFAPVPLGERTIEPSQYVFAGLLLLGAGGQYVGGKLTDRTRTVVALIATYVVLVGASLAFLPAAEAGIVPMLIVCGALGFTIYMTAPIRQALLAEYSDADVRGLSFGYFYLGVYGVGAVGASLAGFVLTYGTTGTFFLVFAAVAALAVGLGVLLIVRYATAAPTTTDTEGAAETVNTAETRETRETTTDEGH
ncbi:Sugar phosphate permease [Halopenitus malekzadehii]|uniref:Sugar phosphate permease n=1 Tax=Halopenitus malekzadehii TaxID=1267564 RepID=A0A1H6IM35_9EURY|nr:MFS transporter [Halopenitus malekzadehii]SEH50115.1 Sugar phosphate permease [Halopenitus malekzadehii]